MFTEYWKMPNGAEGHGVMLDEKRLEEYKRHVDSMNVMYGAGTHWLVDAAGKRLHPTVNDGHI